MNRSKYLFKNIVSFAFGKLGTKLITFLLVPVYTHMLSTDQYGTVDLIATLGTVLTPLLILNVSEAIMRFCLDQGADHNKIMSTALSVLTAGTLIGALLIPICRFVPVFAEYGVYVYGYTISAAYAQVFMAYLRGQEKLTAYSVGNIFHAAVMAGLNILFLVVFHWGVKGYLLANILSNIATALFAAVVGRADKAVRHFGFDRRLSGAMLRFSAVLIPISFMWWIINSSDRIMVTAMIGSVANGIYAIAYKVPSLLGTLSGVFNQAWSYSAIREQNSSDETEYHNQMYNKMVQMLTVVTAGAFVIIKPFLYFFVAPAYYSAWVYTPWLLIGFLFLSLGTFLSASYTVHKDSVAFLLSSMLGAGVNVLLNFLLIPHLGVSGAAIATCMSYFTVYFFRVFNTRRYVKIRVFQLKHLLGFGLLAAMGGTLFWEGALGQIVLLLLFTAILVLSREVFLAFFKGRKPHK